jgi:flagellin FlaB
MNYKKSLRDFANQKRAIVGLEAAIILIAFVIIAAVFSFMVVNQGLFATEQGKTVIQQGIQQASTPLSVDGTTFVKTSADGSYVEGLLIPLKTFGTKYVSMNENTTVVTLKIGSNAWSNVYNGTQSASASETFNNMLTNVPDDNLGKLFIQNSNNDQALDSNEKGYLVVSLGSNVAVARSQVTIEIRLEKTAPLTIEFTIPESMPADAWVNV